MDLDNIAVQEQSRILVVDDNPLILEVINNLLTQENFDVKTCESGQQAMETLAEHDVDVILCDIMMPEMDGFMVQEMFRKSNQHAPVPFIFLTALGRSEDLKKGHESGADAYLVKPFDPEELISVIRGKIARAKAVSEYYRQKQDHFSNQIIRQISHEFRTPLVAVTTGSEFILKEEERISKEKLRSLLQTIWRGGQRLEKLVNNFILLQQIQSGLAKKTYDRKAKQVDLARYLKDYVDKQNYLHVDQGFSFNLNIRSECSVRICVTQLKAILDRLVDNAMKFSKELKVIDFELDLKAKKAIISVKDYGHGFRSETLDSVANVFHQQEREINEQQGSGLGLTIAKFLTRINHGQISFSNTESFGAKVEIKFSSV